MADPLTALPLPRAISRLAWPAMGSVVLLSLFQIVNAFWIARLGTTALGAMSTAAFFVWCLQSIGLLCGAGINAIVARRAGEGDPAAAGTAVGHALLLSTLLSVVAAAGLLPALPALFDWLALDGSLRTQAEAYLQPTLIGLPVLSALATLEAVFRGAGDTRTPLVILGGVLALNAALDPLLIFAAGLGIAGAPWASVISQALGVLLALRLLSGRPQRPRLVRLSGSLLVTLLRVGLPIGINVLLFSVFYILLTPLLAPFGSAALAGLGLGHRIEGLAFFPCVGFSAAAATLVGQHLGAGRADLAARAAWLSSGYACAIVAAAALLYFFGGRVVVGLFSSDPLVLDAGAAYLRAVALFEVGMALEVVLEGAFGGAGNSLPPMLVGVPLTALRIPLGRWLANTRGLGPPGVYLAISLSTGLKGLVIAIWFRLGRWTRSRV